MPVIRFIWGVILVYGVFGLLFVALIVLAGCGVTGDMPVCASGCTVTKTWGVA